MLTVTEELVVDSVHYATIKHMLISNITVKKNSTEKRQDFYNMKLNILKSKN